MSTARGAALALVFAACNSDFPILDSPSSSGEPGGSSSGIPTTSGSETTTGDATTSSSSSSSSSSDEGGSTTPPPEQTCRDVLQCVGMCALNFDLECFQMCTEGLPPEEGQKALALGTCIVQGCFTDGKCTPETIMDVACLGCLGIGLLGGSPEGCEAEAEACE